MEDFVTFRLIHLCMDEEAAIALIDDFLGKQLNALSAVAEDNALIDLKLFTVNSKKRRFNFEDKKLILSKKCNKCIFKFTFAER